MPSRPWSWGKKQLIIYLSNSCKARLFHLIINISDIFSQKVVLQIRFFNTWFEVPKSWLEDHWLIRSLWPGPCYHAMNVFYNHFHENRFILFGSLIWTHTGHMIIANYMVYYTDLQQVWLVVSPQNPLKPAHTLSTIMTGCTCIHSWL